MSVYKNLLFVSGEGLTGRLDCGGEGVKDTVSKERLRGLRIFDITDIANPKNVGNVQTCRGSHTHTVLVDPKDPDNVYVYISGSAQVRSDKELPGCVATSPSTDPNSALFRIEVIKVPLAHPEQAAIVSSPRIFNDLVKPASHGESQLDSIANAKAAADARAHGGYTAIVFGEEMVLPPSFVDGLLTDAVTARGGTGAPTHADSAALRDALPGIIAKMINPPGVRSERRPDAVPRHHGLSGDRSRGRRVRRLRIAARHSRSCASGAYRSGRRLQLLVLALGDLQQRWHQGALQR